MTVGLACAVEWVLIGFGAVGDAAEQKRMDSSGVLGAGKSSRCILVPWRLTGGFGFSNAYFVAFSYRMQCRPCMVFMSNIWIRYH